MDRDAFSSGAELGQLMADVATDKNATSGLLLVSRKLVENVSMRFTRQTDSWCVLLRNGGELVCLHQLVMKSA